MSDDELLKMLDGAGKPLVTERVSPFIRAAEANLFRQAAARIRELSELLEECEVVLAKTLDMTTEWRMDSDGKVAIAENARQPGHVLAMRDILAKLRSQEKADETI